MSRRRTDNIKAPAFIIGMGVACLAHRDYMGAVLMFAVALVALVNLLPPSCSRDCRQGRRGCVCRGMPE